MVLFFCLLMAVTAAQSQAPGVWIDADDFASVHVVMADNGGDVERKAAALFQSTWETCTGRQPSVSGTPEKGVNIWIGADSLPETLRTAHATTGLGRDGVLIQTLTSDGARSLLLAGGDGKGVLYAVYEFFEQAFGVRWLAPDAVHIPAPPASLPPMDYTYTPPFVNRTMGVKGDRGPYRLNTPYIKGISGHSTYTLLPPEEHFEEHPEYYSELKGERVAPSGFDWRNKELQREFPEKLAQLCMSNPGTAKAIAREIDRIAKEKPEANMWSICQMDWGSNCQCAECRAIDEREGTPMGSMLTGLNRIAELVEPDHPESYIHTYAYTYTRKPPRLLKPRQNVIIQLCNIECDFSRPLTDPDSPVNRAYVEDFARWSKLTKNLLTYDYPVNYWRYQMPHPMFPVFGPNMALYADRKVLGVYQLSVNAVTDGFGFLKQYVLGKLLWNPNEDTNALKNEFIDLYYGQAAPYIKEFIALSERKLKESGIELSFDDRGAWMDRAYVEASEDLFKKALASVETEDVRGRVDLAYLQVQFAALHCRAEHTFTESTLTLSRPASISAEEYVARLQHFGIPHIGENQPMEQALEYYGGVTGAREFTCDLVRIENDAYEVWVTPKLEGSILRFRDKRFGYELLRGYKTYGVLPGTWQEWIDRDALGETVAAQEYKLLEQDAHHAVLEAQLDSGLIIRRAMHLRPGKTPLEVELSLRNPTEKPLFAKVKFHPEFDCQTAYTVPEFWLEKPTGWTHLNAEDTSKGPIGVGFLATEEAERWAVHMPEAKLTLINEFDPTQVDQLLYFYNTNNTALHVNLELLPPRSALQPGESRTIKASYEVSTKRPTDL